MNGWIADHFGVFSRGSPSEYLFADNTLAHVLTDDSEDLTDPVGAHGRCASDRMRQAPRTVSLSAFPAHDAPRAVSAAAVMPWLAKEKRRLSGATGSAALRADAAQSALCAYLSLIALVGLAINTIWHVKWADPLAALAVLPLIVWEGQEAMRGKVCGCC